MTQIVIDIVFVIVVIANAIALVRHWHMMRLMRITLNSMIESQDQYVKMLKEAAEIRETRLAPHDP